MSGSGRPASRMANALWHAVTPLPQYETTRHPAARTAREAHRRQEPAVRPEVAAARPVDRGGDVAGDGVDRLDLAPVAFRRPRVDQRDLPEPLVQRSRSIVRDQRSRSRSRPGGQSGTSVVRAPADAVQAWIPPSSRARRDARGRRASTTAAPRSSRPRRRRRRSCWRRRTRARPGGREVGRGGEGMTTRARRRGEVAIEVDEHGARQVPVGVVAPPLLAIVEPPADVGDAQARVVKPVAQRLRGEQGHGRRIDVGEPSASVADDRAATTMRHPRDVRGLGCPR